MSVLLLVLTCDRDDYLEQTLEAFDDMVTGPIVKRVIHDDSGNARHAAKLRRTFPRYRVITSGLKRNRRSGFAGAVRSAWRQTATMGDYEWVFGLEDDFVFQRPVDLSDVIDVLTANPHLSQMAFRRQPWYGEDEEQAGGFCELHAGDMTARTDGNHRWLEHDLLFTTNPHLRRRGIGKLEWPDGERSEDRFWSERLKRFGLPWGVLGDDVRSGFWGDMESGARWVEHIGHERPTGAYGY